MWDEKRAERIVMQRTNPRGQVVLTVRGGQAAFRGLPDWFEPPLYALGDDVVVDAQWAGWAPDGRLLVATVDGRLQVRSGRRYDDVDWEVDLAGLTRIRRPVPRGRGLVSGKRTGADVRLENGSVPGAWLRRWQGSARLGRRERPGGVRG